MCEIPTRSVDTVTTYIEPFNVESIDIKYDGKEPVKWHKPSTWRLWPGHGFTMTLRANVQFNGTGDPGTDLRSKINASRMKIVRIQFNVVQSDDGTTTVNIIPSWQYSPGNIANKNADGTEPIEPVSFRYVHHFLGLVKIIFVLDGQELKTYNLCQPK